MRTKNIHQNQILKLSIEFSLLMIEYCESLELSRKFVIGHQLLKSATSIGANVMEAQNAESRADFIHKMKIAAKESDETQYWLILCNVSKNYPDCKLIQEKLCEIQKVLNAIIAKLKQN